MEKMSDNYHSNSVECIKEHQSCFNTKSEIIQKLSNSVEGTINAHNKFFSASELKDEITERQKNKAQIIENVDIYCYNVFWIENFSQIADNYFNSYDAVSICLARQVPTLNTEHISIKKLVDFLNANTDTEDSFYKFLPLSFGRDTFSSKNEYKKSIVKPFYVHKWRKWSFVNQCESLLDKKQRWQLEHCMLEKLKTRQWVSVIDYHQEKLKESLWDDLEAKDIWTFFEECFLRTLFNNKNSMEERFKVLPSFVYIKSPTNKNKATAVSFRSFLKSIKDTLDSNEWKQDITQTDLEKIINSACEEPYQRHESAFDDVSKSFDSDFINNASDVLEKIFIKLNQDDCYLKPPAEWYYHIYLLLFVQWDRVLSSTVDTDPQVIRWFEENIEKIEKNIWYWPLFIDTPEKVAIDCSNWQKYTSKLNEEPAWINLRKGDWQETINYWVWDMWNNIPLYTVVEEIQKILIEMSQNVDPK